MGTIGHDLDLLDEEHLTEGALPQLHQREKVLRAHLLIVLTTGFPDLVQLVIVLPDLDEFLFPFFVLFGGLILLLFFFLAVDSLLSSLFELFHPLDHHLFRSILFNEELVDIVI